MENVNKLIDTLAEIEFYFVKCANNACLNSSAEHKFKRYVYEIGRAIELVKSHNDGNEIASKEATT